EADAQVVALQEAINAGALSDGVLRGGAGAMKTRLLCGFCGFDESLDHPVTAALPGIIHLRQADLGAEPWIAAALRLLALEAALDGQGSRAVLTRLIEIVVIQATRRLGMSQDAKG